MTPKLILDSDPTSCYDIATAFLQLYSEEQCEQYLGLTAQQDYECAGSPENLLPWHLLMLNTMAGIDAVRQRLCDGELSLQQQFLITVLARAINC